MTTTAARIVIDEGSNQIKTCWLDGEDIRCEVFPARVVHRARMGSNDQKMLSAYEVGNHRFTVAGRIDNPIPTNVPLEYQVSRENRILVHEALRRWGFGGQDVCITTTLPVEYYFDGDEKNAALIQEKTDNLMSDDIKNLAAQDLANIVACEVKPESIPAWFDLMIDETGQLKNPDHANENYRILIVDIGGTTTDITLIDGTGAKHAFRSIEGGVYQIGDHLKTRLIKETDFSHLEVFEIEDALRTQTFDDQDISTWIDDAADETVSTIVSAMRKMFTDAKRLTTAYYVGGGASIIGKTLAKKYGGTSKFGDEFSIARGILKNYLRTEGVTVENDQ